MRNLATLRYSLVAVACIVLHNACVITADALGAATALAVITSFVIVVAAGYLMHSAFTFRAALDWMRFRNYAVSMAANIPLSFIGLWLLHDALDLPMAFASPLASSVMIVTNYALSRWALNTQSSLEESR